MYSNLAIHYWSFLTVLLMFTLVVVLITIIFNMPKARNFLLNLVGILAFPFSLPVATLGYFIRDCIDKKTKRDKKANDFLTHKIKERQILNDL